VILARNTAIHATLWHTLHFPPAVIAQLTLRQIHELAWHPRDEKGHIRFPEPEFAPPTAEMTDEQKLSWLRAIGVLLAPGELERVEAAMKAAKEEPAANGATS
jgi:hypothetical protein